MPDMPFEVETDRLFPEDDPLTMTIKGREGAEPGTPEAGGTFLCLDRANPPLERDVNPNDTPAEYLVATLKLQVVPEQREAFEAAMVSALADDPPRMLATQLLPTAHWLRDQREEAQKRVTARVIDRPTPGAQASTH